MTHVEDSEVNIVQRNIWTINSQVHREYTIFLILYVMAYYNSVCTQFYKYYGVSVCSLAIAVKKKTLGNVYTLV